MGEVGRGVVKEGVRGWVTVANLFWMADSST